MPGGRLRLACVFVLMSVLAVAAQSSPPAVPGRDVPSKLTIGTAVVSGVVRTDEATPVPVRRARVTLLLEAYGNGWSATTDDDGRFVMTGVAAGRYTLQVAKPAWVTSNYGAARPGRPGTPIVIADGERVQGLALRISRGAVITGTVTDAAGQPVPGVNAAVMQFAYSEVTGERVIRPGATAATDDQGAYRLYGLPSGEYLVMATFRAGAPSALMDLRRVTEDEVSRALAEARAGGPGRAVSPATSSTPVAPSLVPLVGFAPVYAPGTPDAAQAARVRVGVAEERAGVNIRMEPVPTARVEAIPSFPDSAANPASLQVYLVSSQPGAGQGGVAMAPGRRDPDGHFVYTGVTPGSYTLIARAAPSGSAPGAPATPEGRGGGAAGPLLFYATAEVAVNGVDLSVPLTIQPGMTASGRVAFDGDPQRLPKDGGGLRMALTPMASGPALSVGTTPVDASGVFQFSGVPAGRYRISYSAPRGLDGWTLVSATTSGRDVLDAPLDVRAGDTVADLVITFTDHPSELAGRLQNASGRAAPDYYIIAFAADRAFWTPLSRRVRQVRPGNDGTFSVRGLPTGDYWIAALTDVEPGEWYDPAFLAQLVPAAARVSVRDGARTVQDLMIK